MELLAIVAGAVTAGAVTLLFVSGLGARVGRRRRTVEAFSELRSLRSPSGRPFFPETPEERRREQRVLRDWDPTYDGPEDVDPDRW